MPVKPSRLEVVCVLSPAGGPVAARALVRLDRPLAVVDRLEELAERLGEAGRVLGEPAQLLHVLGGRCLHRARCPTTDMSPSALNAGVPSCGERAQPREEGVELAGGGLEVPQHRRLRLGQVAEAVHVGLELGQEGRAGGGRSRRGRCRREAEISAVRPASRTKRHTSCLRFSSAPMTVCASPMNFLIVFVWLAEDLERLARLAQRRDARAGARRRGRPGGPRGPRRARRRSGAGARDRGAA